MTNDTAFIVEYVIVIEVEMYFGKPSAEIPVLPIKVIYYANAFIYLNF